ncbi:ribosomal-protein-alanine N-acetyltransferase [Murinocardiopsis flavida]|uniref:Ribosomal-protein-alanine N-acetyltransferase n=1 Tax=Murinocardiopsis flavida TaxID=645275 RepID=A0A2P8DMG8_9ACTN|nr:GNAT family protein [Murinocardiopsis flavida]PSK98397.1 ribosomal-protein-alanine N-acetyltransferase [Murinocardiopsis flavida]
MNRIRGWPVSLEEGLVGLRPLRLRDAAALRESRTRSAEWLRPWEPTHPELPLQSSGLAPYVAMVQAVRREGRHGVAMPWAVTYDGVFAGQLTVGAIVWGSARSAQVGYWVDRAFAGRGVTPTAVALAVDHCFFAAGLHRIEANIRPENRASRRVAEKLGFRAEGVRRRQLHIDGAWRDHICYALTVEDVPGGLLTRWREHLRGGRFDASAPEADDASIPPLPPDPRLP